MSAALEYPTFAVTLRAASGEDFPRIVDLIREMHAEMAPLPLSETRMRGFIAHAIQRGIVLVTEHGGEVVGTCGLVADTAWYSDVPMLADGWLYVTPEHRRTPHASTLIRAALRCALDTRMPLQMGFVTKPGMEDKLRKMERLYRRFFGAPIGMLFFAPAGA